METGRPAAPHATVAALNARIAHLDGEVKRLSVEFKAHLKHRLCYKCAARAQAAATAYRIVETRQGRLFCVEEEADGAWRTLTRRTTRQAAEQALEETKALRNRRAERTLRLARDCGGDQAC